MPRITNINGTSDTTCKCGSWINHWKNFSRQKLPTFCPVYGCYQKDLVGAHVQKAYAVEPKWYIIPLCSRHNEIKTDLDVVDTVAFVSAKKNETCEKI
jgi:hypothetical protein